MKWDWGQQAAWAQVHLGITEEAFWRLSRPQFLWLVSTWADSEETLDRRAATVAQAVAAFSGSKKTWRITDFMPARRRARRKTNDELLAKVQELNALFGGLDLRGR